MTRDVRHEGPTGSKRRRVGTMAFAGVAWVTVDTTGSIVVSLLGAVAYLVGVTTFVAYVVAVVSEFAAELPLDVRVDERLPDIV